jgi:hypothetical protein
LSAIRWNACSLFIWGIHQLGVCVWLWNGNGRAAVVEYQRQYWHCMFPHHSTFANVYRCWRETGSCPRATREHVQQRRDDSVLDAVQRSLTSCVHRISRTTGVPPTQVWRLLHSDGLYPYHLQRVQRLSPWDCVPCVEFCEWLQANLNLLPHILFTDEATFNHDGVNNTRNSHAWAHQNPQNITVCAPVDAAWWSCSSCYQRSNSIPQWTFCWSMIRKTPACAMPSSVTWPIAIRLFCVGLHEIQGVLEWEARHKRAADAKNKWGCF